MKTKILVILLVIAGIGALIFYWPSNKGKGTKNKAAINNSSVEGDPPDPKFSNGLTYQNSDYGFSFSRFEGTEVKKNTQSNGFSIDGFSILGEDGSESSVWVYKTDCSSQCFQNEIIEWSPKTKIEGHDVKINGNTGFEINFDDNGKIKRRIFLTNGKGLVVYFEFSGLLSSSEALSAENQKILDSFMFT
jgi:hypothetical protein